MGFNSAFEGLNGGKAVDEIIFSFYFKVLYMPQYSGENREKHSEFPVAGPWSESRISGLRIQSLNTTSHCVSVSGLRANVLIYRLKYS